MNGYPRAPFDGAFSTSARQAPVKNVVIEIGPSLIQYHLPASLLTHHSEYFQKALNGPWKEYTGEPIKLDDESPAVFNLFVNWFYRQKIPFRDDHWVAEAEQDAVGALETMNHNHWNEANMLKIMLYAFADRFMVHSLYTAMNRFLASDYEGPPCLDVITYAFTNLRHEDPILDFMVDTYFVPTVSRVTESERWEEEERWEEKVPREFLVRVTRRVRRSADVGDLVGTAIDSCDYHGHSDALQRKMCKQRQGLGYLKEHLLLTLGDK